MPQSSILNPATSELAQHVAAGLRKTPKTLSSMYFYDDAGSRLFQQIMALPEYYPTRAEAAIFQQHGRALAAALSPAGSPDFSLVELGAGDGAKTKLLLRELLQGNAAFTYAPVDISAGAMTGLVDTLRRELPALRVAPVVEDYATALTQLRTWPGTKAVLFLGSNIGNFGPAERLNFLRQLAAPLGPADRLLIGFDLQKDPRRIRAAYDDAQGVTAAFNLNLLTRLNRELGADFDLAHWQHYTDYSPLSGAVRSFLVSTRAQQVHIAALEETVDFAAWEVIHTENSFKFTLPQIEALAAEAGLRVVTFFTDAAGDFADVVLAAREG
ncbi:L-histidine N(alpha)-methyltransferase [Hymenobacter properus]|uniref:L-histidine N(Alpha)-methyltransferase n=1 Tax=Hymenobacter properus TaxID=2791026 RepID=A0A931FLD4_9BACT|nr:L-histidine N(alpha)-methyltransferase [Hymenobacter properus]MBF9144073.1 L-histidine N(alpha)-methyltransferase [Hymenobacter properus]MBR7722889.1 L-histidine N(alpha)-methyltransferase [Microvirga sp. SRT04]